jgi:nitrogen fixation/metabolism regulation signal transduction histidine kinase
VQARKPEADDSDIDLRDVCRHASQSRTNQVLFMWHVQARSPEADDPDIDLRDVCRHAS